MRDLIENLQKMHEDWLKASQLAMAATRDEQKAKCIAADKFSVQLMEMIPEIVQRIMELEKSEKEAWLLADQKIIELKAVKNELKQNLKVIINKNEQLIDKNEQIIGLEKEADILADRLSCHNQNCNCGFDMKYWRNWARDNREKDEVADAR